MTDPVQAIADWISKEPESTEVIIIRRRGGQFHVKLEYGNRTSVPRVASVLADALTAATQKANALPSSARFYGERELKSKRKEPASMPGMATGVMPGS